MTRKPEDQIIIYKALDGKSQVALYARDGNIWLTQKQIAELFDTPKQKTKNGSTFIWQNHNLPDIITYF